MCEALAPAFFSVDDARNLTVLAADVPLGDEAQVREAVLCCPVDALKITED